MQSIILRFYQSMLCTAHVINRVTFPFPTLWVIFIFFFICFRDWNIPYQAPPFHACHKTRTVRHNMEMLHYSNAPNKRTRIPTLNLNTMKLAHKQSITVSAYQFGKCEFLTHLHTVLACNQQPRSHIRTIPHRTVLL